MKVLRVKGCNNPLVAGRSGTDASQAAITAYALLCSWSSRHARVSAKFGVTKKSGAAEMPSGRVTAMSKLRSMAVHADDVLGGQQHIPEGFLEVGIHLRTLHDTLNPKPLNPKP